MIEINANSHFFPFQTNMNKICCRYYRNTAKLSTNNNSNSSIPSLIVNSSAKYNLQSTVYPPAKTHILATYKQLLKYVRLISLGQNQFYAESRNEDISGMIGNNAKYNKYSYDSQFVNEIKLQYRKNKNLTDPKKMWELHRVAAELLSMYMANLEHSRYLVESGWGLKQATKNHIRNVARRVGLEISAEGQQVNKTRHTSLAGTAAEKFKLGEGIKVANQNNVSANRADAYQEKIRKKQ